MASLSSLWPFGDSTSTLKVTDTLAENLYDRSRDARLQTVRPYKDTENGLERGMKLLTALHDPDTGILSRNKAEPLSFELHYDADTELLQPRIATQTDEQFELVDRQVQSHYDNSDTREVDPAFLEVYPGQHVAGTTLQLRQRKEFERLRPIKNFQIDPDHFEIGPYRSIGREMIGAAHRPDCDVLVQSVIKPAVSTARWDRQNWWYGIDKTVDSVTGKGGDDSIDWGQIGREIAEPFQQAGMTEEQRRSDRRRRRRKREREDELQYIGSSDDEPTASRSEEANLLDSQRGMRGYHLCVRIIAVSDDPEEAQQRVQDTAGMFRNFYDSRFQQGFTPINLSNRKLYDMLKRAASRDFTDRKITFSVDTITGVCKIPTDIALQQFDYSMSAAGRGVPPRTSRHDWNADGLDRATASRADRQRALLATEDPMKPVWFGDGKKNEVEAGVEPDILNVHLFCGGTTGTGKTTLLINYFRQIMQRGHGGLFFDPKGQDAEDVVQVLPDHREDDLVFLDIGADAEYEVGFNFLEIPLENPDPDSKAFDSAVSALADDFEALLAQSGDGSSWGPRMSGITRAVVRGLAEYQVRSDKTVTMLDMAFLLSGEEGRQRIHDMMAEQRIEWIQQATHVIADYSQDDLEPLVRRLWEWIFSRTVRSVTSHPSTTISIDDIVREGKIVVVKNSSGGDTVKRLVATALIRRIWFAIQRQTKRDDQPDPPQFFTICDEFDKIVNEKSNIPDILSQARSFGLSLTFASQNLDSGGKNTNKGIPKSVQKAIRGNCKTFLSFSPGDPDDADDIARQHSKNIEGEDINELDDHHIYMRTKNDRGDNTDSYKVHTFPPASEVLDVRSEAEADALIQESQERYGQPVRTDEEVKEEMFIDESVGGVAAEAEASAEATQPTELDMDDERVRNRALKAVYDVSIRQGKPDEFVAVEACVNRLRRYLPGDEINSAGQAWRNVLQHLSDRNLAHRDRDDQMQIKVVNKPFMNLGEKENDASAEHWAPMENAYVPMTQLGFVFDIPAQTGGAMPDARAKLDDVLHLDGIADPDDIADKVNSYREEYPTPDRLAGTDDAYVESEHSTGETQPSQTVINLAQAHNAGHRCLFMCRPQYAEHVYDTVANEPTCRRTKHSVEGEERFYTGTQPMRIDGEKITRPGTKDSVWVYDKQTGQYILRDTDGTEHARFDTASEIYQDASAYPSGGEWNIYPPTIPEYLFEADPAEAEWDIIVVPEPPEDEDGEQERLTPADLELYRENDENVSLIHLHEADEAEDDASAPAQSNTEPSVTAEGSGGQSEAHATDGGADRDTDTEADGDADTDDEPASGDSDDSLPRMGQ